MIGIVNGEKGLHFYGWPLTLLFLSINLGTIKLAPIMYGTYPSVYNILTRLLPQYACCYMRGEAANQSSLP